MKVHAFMIYSCLALACVSNTLASQDMQPDFFKFFGKFKQAADGAMNTMTGQSKETALEHKPLIKRTLTIKTRIKATVSVGVTYGAYDKAHVPTVTKANCGNKGGSNKPHRNHLAKLRPIERYASASQANVYAQHYPFEMANSAVVPHASKILPPKRYELPMKQRDAYEILDVDPEDASRQVEQMMGDSVRDNENVVSYADLKPVPSIEVHDSNDVNQDLEALENNFASSNDLAAVGMALVPTGTKYSNDFREAGSNKPHYGQLVKSRSAETYAAHESYVHKRLKPRYPCELEGSLVDHFPAGISSPKRYEVPIKQRDVFKILDVNREDAGGKIEQMMSDLNSSNRDQDLEALENNLASSNELAGIGMALVPTGTKSSYDLLKAGSNKPHYGQLVKSGSTEPYAGIYTACPVHAYLYTHPMSRHPSPLQGHLVDHFPDGISSPKRYEVPIKQRDVYKILDVDPEDAGAKVEQMMSDLDSSDRNQYLEALENNLANSNELAAIGMDVEPIGTKFSYDLRKVESNKPHCDQLVKSPYLGDLESNLVDHLLSGIIPPKRYEVPIKHIDVYELLDVGTQAADLKVEQMMDDRVVDNKNVVSYAYLKPLLSIDVHDTRSSDRDQDLEALENNLASSNDIEEIGMALVPIGIKSSYDLLKAESKKPHYEQLVKSGSVETYPDSGQAHAQRYMKRMQLQRNVLKAPGTKYEYNTNTKVQASQHLMQRKGFKSEVLLMFQIIMDNLKLLDFALKTRNYESTEQNYSKFRTLASLIALKVVEDEILYCELLTDLIDIKNNKVKHFAKFLEFSTFIERKTAEYVVLRSALLSKLNEMNMRPLPAVAPQIPIQVPAEDTCDYMDY